MDFRTALSVIFVGCFPAFYAIPALGDEWPDPAPPKVHEVSATIEMPEAESFPRLTFFQEPHDLHPDAVVSDWPRFLGPNDDGSSPETHLLAKFPEEGLQKVWEIDKGTGYTSAVVVDDRLVLFDRIDGEERVDCLDPFTGKRFWEFSYDVQYTDRYGFNDGPRASAIINSGKVYTLGVRSMLTCLDLKTGTLLWQRNLRSEFGIADYFFGHGSCPLVYDGKVIVNMGGDDNLSVAAFDQHTGKLIWGTKHEWKSSYASPVVKELQGAPRLLVFAGGESDPAVGGLLCIDPSTGQLHDAFPWRADKYESVNGQTPVKIGENRAFVSDAYQIGGVALDLTPELKWEVAWKAPFFGMHWMTPEVKDGTIYGFRGRNEPDAWLAAYDAETGDELWKEETQWEIKLATGQDYRMSYFRGSMLLADGRTYALGELGSLGILNLTQEGPEYVDVDQLFLSRSTWSLPVLYHGLLFISRHEPDHETGEGRKLICYDLRAGE